MKLRLLIASLALSAFADRPARALEATSASSLTTELNALVAQVKSDVAAGKKTDGDLATDLAAFDKLLEKYRAMKGQSSEDLAKIPYFKAMVYQKVLNEPDKAKAVLVEISKEFPGTKAANVVAQPTASASASSGRQPLLAEGTPAPDFTAIAVAGGEGSLNLAQYKGKIVVLDFWSTWCGPCQHSLPHVERVYQDVKGKDVVVIGVCVWDNQDAYAKWLPEHTDKYTFTFAFDPAGRDNSKSIASSLYNVSGIPTTYVIGKDGRVVDSILGYNGENDKRLEEALARAGVKVTDS
jgi:thiol-disulfide isomerase/thioredoxin